MDRCRGKRPCFYLQACQKRSPRPPHFGLSASTHHYSKLKYLKAYFMALPTPVLSDGDIVQVQSRSYKSAKMIWNTWSQDPIKAAVLQSVVPCQVIMHSSFFEYRNIFSRALGQHRVCPLHYSSLKREEVHYLNVFRIPQQLMICSLR